MSFELVDDVSNANKLLVPVTGTNELFAGQLVQWTGEGVAALGVANGAYDATDDSVVAGIVLGTTNEDKVFEDGTTVSGFAGEEITGLVTQAGLTGRTQIGNRGMYAKGEKMCLVEIAKIYADTRIKGRFYNAAYGTAPTLLTSTNTSTDGLGITTNAADVAGVVDFSTLYCRSGANARSYRVTDDTSTTVHTNDIPITNDIAIGATFVKVFGKQGFARLQFDAQSLYINTAAVTTSYWGVFIDTMDLRVAGEESCIFTFSAQHLGIPTA